MKQVFQQDKAVTPIIATILLIGITVVLAATLIVILHSFTTSSHIEEVSANQYLCGPYNNTNGNLYFLNVTSTSIQVPLGQISINMYNGSILVYSGTLAPHTFKNVTITSALSNFAAGSDIKISVAGHNDLITSVSLIYASSVFATVNPT